MKNALVAIAMCAIVAGSATAAQAAAPNTSPTPLPPLTENFSPSEYPTSAELAAPETKSKGAAALALPALVNSPSGCRGRTHDVHASKTAGDVSVHSGITCNLGVLRNLGSRTAPGK